MSEEILTNGEDAAEIQSINIEEPVGPLFSELGLSEPVLAAVSAAGYEAPSPIQAKAIPVLLQGKNLLGTAQTGTGKTAAFSLPMLSRLDFSGPTPAMLVLTPTRELSIQVAEAIQSYAVNMPKIHIVPVYGGQDIGVQLKALKRNVSIVVATPGRLLDHIRRGSVSLARVQSIVLDEADEMLDMGFAEEVEGILKEIPETAQRALFSATMPDAVKKIVDRYLGIYEEVRIEGKTATVENIAQRYVMVRPEHKIEALCRILEGENFDGLLIFVRTKQQTAELSERLEARGFNAAPLSGDLAQALRERTINRLKTGKLDIVVATDVAARGIDVDRITHVVNYDVPYDTESYVHRVGRTGRAGRTGNAILFITPRERRLLKMIEKATRQPISPMDMPTGEQISEKRVAAFRKKVLDKVNEGELDQFRDLIQSLAEESEVPMVDLAAALTALAQEGQPLFPEMEDLPAPAERGKGFKAEKSFGLGASDEPRKPRKEGENGVEEGFLRYYLGVGRKDHVSPRDIVGAIAGESGISSSEIGRIKLFDKFSTVELPQDVPEALLTILENMSIRGNPSRFRLMTDEPPQGGRGGFGGGDFGGRGEKKAHRGGRKIREREGRAGFDGERRDFVRGGDDRPFRRAERSEGRPFRRDRDDRPREGRPFHGGERPFAERGDKPFRKTRRFGRH